MFTDLRPIHVFQAAGNIRDLAHPTPLRHSPALSRLAGGDVHLKLETEQITGSFKLRGALNTLASLTPDERRRGVVTSSAGNHGLGVAFAARHWGAPALIFVPRSAPQVKKDGIAALGATIDDSATDYDHAMALAIQAAAERGVPFINPCLGDPLLAGQGTVALEIVAELPHVRSVVTCVGGGGLLGGMGVFLRGVAPHVRIHGAQSEQTAAMTRSLRAGQVVEIPSVPTLADGLAGQIDAEALAIGQAMLDDVVLLSEDDIARTIAWLAREEGVTAEGAGAVAVGAVLLERLTELRFPAAIVVSGRNIDEARHAEVLARFGAPGDA
ncbi:MAG TPA: pyridoxal-phosphate dependent enzyme [Gemmatimonadaceae bacterium]|nr:pyridoxal-phosphate dependent enzyme [Gemmatimonadaceae bacterium]